MTLSKVGGRGLLLQRFAQFIRALRSSLSRRRSHRDDGLGGEVRDQFDLLVGERLALLR